MKFSGLFPGELFVFAGQEAQYQALIAGEYIRRHKGEARFHELGFVVPSDPIFAKLRAEVDADPDLCVVTSFVMPPHMPFAAYLPLDAIAVEVRAHPGPMAEIRFGNDVQYLKPVNSHFTAWTKADPPSGLTSGIATHG